jgi:lysozyme
MSSNNPTFSSLNAATTKLVKTFEGLHDGDLTKIGLQPKMDPVGIWTEGYGSAMIDPRTGKHLRGAANAANAIKWQTIHTESEAVQALSIGLIRYSKLAAQALGVDVWQALNPNQQGALTSFVYNCGTGAPPFKIFKNIRLFLQSKFTKDQLIGYWRVSVINGGGKVLPGLVRRRAAEVELFFTI